MVSAHFLRPCNENVIQHAKYISAFDAIPMGSQMYLYLPKGQEQVVKYDNCSSSFKLWYLQLTSISTK